MLKIYLLRHGETVWNTEQRLQGHLDSPLTEKGRDQARNNGNRLRLLIRDEKFRLISSPLGRCRQTAELIGSELGFDADQIELDDRLKELCYGDWEGKTKREIQTKDAVLHQKRITDRWNVAAPGGECYSDVANRLSSWLTELEDETIIVVSHGCAGRILRGLHGKLDPDEISNLDESHNSIYLLSQGAAVEKIA